MKEYFAVFYDKVKTKVWAATILLSISLLIRSILNLLRFSNIGLNEKIAESLDNDTWFTPLYNLCLFIFSDVAPISAQLLSMIFGLIRRNQLKDTPGISASAD